VGGSAYGILGAIWIVSGVVGVRSKGATEVEVAQVSVLVNENVEEIVFPYDVFRRVTGSRAGHPDKGGEP